MEMYNAGDDRRIQVSVQSLVWCLALRYYTLPMMLFFKSSRSEGGSRGSM